MLSIIVSTGDGGQTSSTKCDKESPIPLNLSTDMVEDKASKRGNEGVDDAIETDRLKRIKTEQTEATDLSMKSSSEMSVGRLTRPKAKPKPRPLVLPDSSMSLFRPPVSSPLSPSPCSSLSPSTLNSPVSSSSPSMSSHQNGVFMSKTPHSPSLQTPFISNFPAPLPSPSLFANYPSPFIPLATPMPHPHQLHFWSSLSPLAVASPRYPLSGKNSSGSSGGSESGPESANPSSSALLSAFPNSSSLPSLSPSHFTFPVPAFPFTTPLSFSNPLRSPLFTPGPHLNITNHHRSSKDKWKDEAETKDKERDKEAAADDEHCADKSSKVQNNRCEQEPTDSIDRNGRDASDSDS